MKRILSKLKIKSNNDHSVENLRKQILKAINYYDESSTAKIFAQINDDMRIAVLNPPSHDGLICSEEDPFTYAILHGLTSAVTSFLPYIININRDFYDVGTPLHVACDKGAANIIKLLLTQADIKLNEKDRWLCSTPLQLLIRYIRVYGAHNGVIEAALLLINDPRLNLSIKDGFHAETALDLFEKYSNQVPWMPKKIGEELLSKTQVPEDCLTATEPTSEKTNYRM